MDEIEDIDGIWEVVIRAMQNGMIYGYRVRFLHSMAYQLATLKTNTGISGTLAKIWKSVKMGLDHGKVLAIFAIVYRLVRVMVIKIRHRSKGYLTKVDADFIAGFVGGVLIYSGLMQKLIQKHVKRAGLRRMLALNEAILAQITMYTLSRLVLAGGRDLARLTVPKERVDRTAAWSWIATCGVVWGGVMVYFKRDRDTLDERSEGPLLLPRALRVSLEFIYGGVSHAWREAFDYGR
jgi:hypothetical protein